MIEDSQLPFVIAGMVLFAVALSIVALFVASRLLGWPQLAEAYPDRPDDPILEKYFVQSLFIAKPGASLPGPYIQGPVTLIACEGGLRIAVWPIFRAFFKTIFIPWDEISTTTVQAKVTRLKGCGLRVGGKKPFTLTIIARVARKISAATNGKLEIPADLQR
ncbi:MAG: hypothetical protein AAF291_03980 [Pseudomonadota bacterium]